VARATDENRFASLKPALLARKGGAKPAMRQQLAALEQAYGPIPDADDLADDLGWNDFGPETATANRVVPITRRADERKAAPSAPETAAGRKAAFTLRLDPERHLKLRLACAVDARSAQALVIDALDRLLDAMPELDSLAQGAAAVRGKPRPAKA